MTRARDLADSADKDIAGTLTLDAVNASGVITGLTVEATGDTAAGDNAAMGYTAAEGLILTGQGSTSDITLKNDADAVVFTVPTGTDDILFPDNAKAMFGADSDLQIHHDGSNSYVDDTGTGRLYLRGNDRVQIQKYTGEDMITAIADGAVNLYHNNSKKFETSSTGGTISGTSGAALVIQATDANTYPGINLINDAQRYDLQIDGSSDSFRIYDNTNSKSLLSMSDAAADFNPSALNMDFRVRSDSNDNALFVDAGESHVCLNTATDHGGVLNVETTGNAVNMVLVCTDTDTGEGPIMDLTRDAGNVPSDGDLMGVIRFRNDNNNLAMQNYATISSTCTDVTDGTEDGKLTFKAMHGGSLVEFLRLEGTSNGIVFNDDRALLDFRVASGGNNNMFLVDASADTIGIGTTEMNVVGNNTSGINFLSDGMVGITRLGVPLKVNRRQDGDIVEFYSAAGKERTISISGSTTSYNDFSGLHESSGILTNTPVGTVVSTIDELDVYAAMQGFDTEQTPSPKAGQTRTDHAKVKVSDTAGDACVYGVVGSFNAQDKVNVVSVGIGSVRVTGACAKGDLLESNGDGTAKVQSDDIVRSKTIGKVTIGNSNTGVKLVSCVMYCG